MRNREKFGKTFEHFGSHFYLKASTMRAKGMEMGSLLHGPTIRVALRFFLFHRSRWWGSFDEKL